MSLALLGVDFNDTTSCPKVYACSIAEGESKQDVQSYQGVALTDFEYVSVSVQHIAQVCYFVPAHQTFQATPRSCPKCIQLPVEETDTTSDNSVALPYTFRQLPLSVSIYG